MYDSLINLNDETAYRVHYEQEYCSQVIITHDGVIVSFPNKRFEHAFYKSSNRRLTDKAIFSVERAQRMMWIKKVLADESLPMYQGWDKKKKRYDPSHRCTIVTPDGYVVVIRFESAEKAIFVTAFVVDDSSVEAKIRSNPVWV